MNMSSGENHSVDEFAEPATDPAVVYHSSPGETNAEAVVTALSSASGIDGTDLNPIYEAVDPDALNDLFGPRNRGTPPDGHVAFDHGSYHVRVESDGTVRVY